MKAKIATSPVRLQRRRTMPQRNDGLVQASEFARGPVEPGTPPAERQPVAPVSPLRKILGVYADPQTWARPSSSLSVS